MFSAGHVRTPRDSIEQWYGHKMPGADQRLVRFMAQFVYDKLLEGGKNPGLLEAGLQFVESISGYVTGRVRNKIRELGGEAINSFSLRTSSVSRSTTTTIEDSTWCPMSTPMGTRGRARIDGARSATVTWASVGPPHRESEPARASHRRPTRALSGRSSWPPPLHTCRLLAGQRADDEHGHRRGDRVAARSGTSRGIGVRLGRQTALAGPGVQAIMDGTGKIGYAALRFVPREDVDSRRMCRSPRPGRHRLGSTGAGDSSAILPTAPWTKSFGAGSRLSSRT